MSTTAFLIILRVTFASYERMDVQKLAAVIVAKILLKRRQERKKKTCWIRPWIRRRTELGACSTLVKELQIEDAQQFRNFVRMNAVQVQYIIELIGPKIAKRNTKMREAISVNERVMVTLRFLASGDSDSGLQYLFRIPVCTIGRIVKEVAPAIYIALKDKYMQFPNSTNEWLNIVNPFNMRWNFPHCLGAIDGKHIVIQAPYNSGSHYYNYKGTNSIVLLGVADAQYKFIYVDVGCNGRISDGGVFQNCSLSDGLEKGSLHLPLPEPLPNRDMPVPYCFVADDAFAMKSYILKPYPFHGLPAANRVFNYRLSRARRIIENVFGILANKFRVLRKPILLDPNKVVHIVLAICALHNFLLTEEDSRMNYFHQGLLDTEDPETREVTPGNWRDEATPTNSYLPLQSGTRNNYTVSQKLVRDEFKEYFMTPSGEVLWQYKKI